MTEDKKVDTADALWTQALEGGIGAEYGPIWVKVYESGTKLKSRATGKYIPISEEAHVKALDSWKSKMPEIVGHVDHNRDVEFNLGITDIKYDPGNGLFFKMKPANDTLRTGLMNGTIKPSIEIDYTFDSDLKDGSLINYKPTGLGLMVNGVALSKDVGPSMPDFDTALGGESMVEKTKEEVDAFIGSVKTAFEGDKEKFVAEKATWDGKLKEFFGESIPEEHTKLFNKYFEDAKVELGKKKKKTTEPEVPKEEDDQLAKLLKQLDEMKKEKEELNKKLEKLVNSDAQKTELENVLKKQYGEAIKTLLDADYDWQNKTLDKVKDDYLLVSMIETKRKKEMPKPGLPPVGGSPPPGSKKDFDEKGIVTNERFEEIAKGVGVTSKQRPLVSKKTF